MYYSVSVSGSCAVCPCSLENKSASNKVFLAVADALQKFPFTFRGARLLSGQEEGAFGWVTVNYLDDRLKQVWVQIPIRMYHGALQSFWLLSCTNLMFWCRACKQKALLTLEGPLLKSPLYPIILMAQSLFPIPRNSDSMAMTTNSTPTASSAMGKTKRCDWHWPTRLE